MTHSPLHVHVHVLHCTYPPAPSIGTRTPPLSLTTALSGSVRLVFFPAGAPGDEGELAAVVGTDVGKRLGGCEGVTALPAVVGLEANVCVALRGRGYREL